MKKTIKNLFFLIIGLFLITSCYEIRGPLNYGLINNSNKTIYDGMSFDYPDTNIKKINKPVSKTYPGQQQSNTLSNFALNPTLQIFIFDADVIENEPWDTIVKYNKYLKRYQFTRAELENMGGNIVYDGN